MPDPHATPDRAAKALALLAYLEKEIARGGRVCIYRQDGHLYEVQWDND